MLPGAVQLKVSKADLSVQQLLNQQVSGMSCFTIQQYYFTSQYFAFQGLRTHFLVEREALKHALVHQCLLSGAVRDQFVSLRLELALLLET